MPIAIEVESHQVDIAQIVETVFHTMLDLDVQRSNVSSAAVPNSLTAAVHFAGDWKGAVLLQCGLPEALAFTNCLMPGYEHVGADEDVRDALGELANMVGGNLKSVLPPGVALSIPSVVAGTDYALHICGGNEFKTVSFSSDLGTFWVTLVQVVDRKRKIRA
jgi:chemotaxis protein CheX